MCFALCRRRDHQAMMISKQRMASEQFSRTNLLAAGVGLPLQTPINCSHPFGTVPCDRSATLCGRTALHVCKLYAWAPATFANNSACLMHIIVSPLFPDDNNDLPTYGYTKISILPLFNPGFLRNRIGAGTDLAVVNDDSPSTMQRRGLAIDVFGECLSYLLLVLPCDGL